MFVPPVTKLPYGEASILLAGCTVIPNRTHILVTDSLRVDGSTKFTMRSWYKRSITYSTLYGNHIVVTTYFIVQSQRLV